MNLKPQSPSGLARSLGLAALGYLALLHAGAEDPVSFHAIDAESLGRVPAGAMVLHNNWQMRDEAAIGDNGAQFSTVAFKPEGWYGTTVPTTVLGALVRRGLYPDPYIGTNNDVIPDASAPGNPWSKPWWFRNTFRIPAAQTGKVIWLHLDGINYRAAVWVNGTEVATETETVGMFRRFRFNVTKLVHAGAANALAIRIFPVDYAGILGIRRPGTDPKFQQNVTQMSALGWDWVPTARDRNMGIWQHVWIEASGPVAVWDPAAFTDVQLPGGKQAAVTLRLHVENAGAGSQPTEIVAEIRPQGFAGNAIRVAKRVVVQPGAPQEVVLAPSEFPALNMKNPRLWWPHGYGGQPLYSLTVETRVRGVASHRQATQFGVRKIGSYYYPPEFAHTLIPTPDGEDPYKYPDLKAARVFTVNGRPIRMAGGSFVPDFLLTWSAQQYRDQVRLMTEGNHTVVRVWGGGILLPDAFYEEADRRGLLVWQDLARSSFETAWKKKEADIPPVDKDLYLANMRDTILRLRGRTSLLAWCGTNESAMQTDIGMALQNEILPALDGTRPWIPSTSTEPPWATEPLGMRSFGPYEMQDILYYFDQYAHASDFIFKNEIGLESLPRLNSIEKSVPNAGELAADGSWASAALAEHGLPAKSLTPRITATIGAPVSFADFAGMSELLSAQSYRAIFEAANKNRPRNPGTMVWMTNGAWLDCMYQLYDWYLHPTAAYYAVKSASQSLHVQYAADDHTLQVVSTRPESMRVHVRATLASASGAKEEVKEYDLTVAADATTNAGPAPMAVADGKLHFLALDLQDDKGRQLDRLVTWTQVAERWNGMLHLPPVEVTASVVAVEQAAPGETQYRVRVVNRGSVPAVHVWVEVNHGPLGQEILPSFWSDNALTLLPGEERLVLVTIRDAERKVGPPRLMVEGFNVLPREFSVSSRDSVVPIRLEVAELTTAKSNGQLLLTARLRQNGEDGPRWTTWPVEVTVDGRNERTFRVDLQAGRQALVHIPLDLAPGPHRIQIGDKTLEAYGNP
jgi:beta-galactosidase/beta-glucuronidase